MDKGTASENSLLHYLMQQQAKVSIPPERTLVDFLEWNFHMAIIHKENENASFE